MQNEKINLVDIFLVNLNFSFKFPGVLFGKHHLLSSELQTLNRKRKQYTQTEHRPAIQAPSFLENRTVICQFELVVLYEHN